MINFLTDCGNKNLQYLLVPSRPRGRPSRRWDAITTAPSTRTSGAFRVCTLGRLSTSPAHRSLFRAGRSASRRRREQARARSAAREAQRKAAQKEIEEFTGEFLNARPPASEAFARVDASPTAPRAGREASLPPHRQGQLRHARQGRNHQGRQGRRKGEELPRHVRRAEPRVPYSASTPAQGARSAGHEQGRRGGGNVRLPGEDRSAAWRWLLLTARLGSMAAAVAEKPGSLVDVRSSTAARTRGASASATRKRPTPNLASNFWNAARKCFEMIDVDESGTLEKAEMSARCVRPSTARVAAAHTPSTRHGAYRAIPPQRRGRHVEQKSDLISRQLRE